MPVGSSLPEYGTKIKNKMISRKEALKEIEELMDNYAKAPVNTSAFTSEKVLTMINDILSDLKINGQLD